MPGIEVDGVSKRFGAGESAVQALEPVDLAIHAGELVALVGPSGCGKTTLLRVLAGLTPPSGGSARIDGREVWDGDRAEVDAVAGLAVVFQEAQLLPWLSVEENIALPLRLRGAGKDERLPRAREMCALLEIDGFEQHRPTELSIGMRQRAAIGRALIASPEVLLLDEPFAALDAITRDTMNVELQRVWLRHPSTCVLVTHSIVEAVFLADRVVALTSRPGRIAGQTPVPFERARPLELQHTPEFQDVVREVRSLLVRAA